METIRRLAIDPKQYDMQSVNWIEEGGIGLENPSRAQFWEYIKPFAAHWKGKDILDIGCGQAGY